MSHSRPNALSSSSSLLFRPSHRTLPEQIVGFAIFVLIGFGFELLDRWIASFSLHREWSSWALEGWPSSLGWFCYRTLLSLSIWTLWRRYSFRTLKLELSLFLTLFAFQALWRLSFFFFQESLLALFGLLLLLSAMILSTLLFWKKEKVSGKLLIPPFFWVFYVMGINMAICIFNP